MRGKGPAVVYAPFDPRELREHAGLTQVDMALFMGISCPVIVNGNRFNDPDRQVAARDCKGARNRQKGARRLTRADSSRRFDW
jgi:hypothetical protein